MDDLIVYGALSIAAMYAITVLVVAGIAVALAEILFAATTSQTGRAAGILAILLLFLGCYAGTGIWLQKSGRI